MAQGTQVVTWQGALVAQVKKNKDAIKDVAASGVDVLRLYRQFVNQVALNPNLQKCTPQSIVRSLIQAAELGLTPSSSLGECYLVPFGTNCQLIIGYRGLIALARRSGEIVSISAGVIYEGDDYEVERGLNEKLRHVPRMKSSKPEDILYVYAVAHLKGGGVQFEVMPKREVDAIRARSRSGNEGPWKTDYAEMAKKTVVRRLAKYLPLTIEGIRATEIDDSNDFGEGEAITIDVPVSADPFTEEGGEDVTE